MLMLVLAVGSFQGQCPPVLNSGKHILQVNVFYIQLSNLEMLLQFRVSTYFR